MGCLNKKMSKLLIYFFITLLLAGLTFFGFTSNIRNSSFEHPLIFAAQHQFEILSLQPSLQDKSNLDILLTVVGLFLQALLLCKCDFVRNHVYSAYERLNISRLIIVYKNLLLPRKNTSKYKTSLIFN